MCPKDADRMANSVDPDQTPTLIGVYTFPRPVRLNTHYGRMNFQRSFYIQNKIDNFVYFFHLFLNISHILQDSCGLCGSVDIFNHPLLFFLPTIWAPPSEFVSSSIPSWQISTAHAQPFRGATDLAFCLKVPLDSLLVWASSEGSGETARMRRLAWTFAARIGDKYQIRLAWPICYFV